MAPSISWRAAECIRAAGPRQWRHDVLSTDIEQNRSPASNFHTVVIVAAFAGGAGDQKRQHRSGDTPARSVPPRSAQKLRPDVNRDAQGHHQEDRKHAATKIGLQLVGRQQSGWPRHYHPGEQRQPMSRGTYRAVLPRPPDDVAFPAFLEQQLSRTWAAFSLTPAVAPFDCEKSITNSPPSKPVASDIGPINGERRSQQSEVMAMLSTPVCGVDSRNDVAAAAAGPVAAERRRHRDHSARTQRAAARRTAPP